MEQIWSELIKGLIAIAIAYVTTQMTIKRSLGETLAIIKDRMDVLWDIYVKDAVREARKASLVRENSPLSVTDEWEKTVPPDIRARLAEFIKKKKLEGKGNSLVLRSVIKEFLGDLYTISVEKDISIPALLGTLVVYIGEDK